MRSAGSGAWFKTSLAHCTVTVGKTFAGGTHALPVAQSMTFWRARILSADLTSNVPYTNKKHWPEIIRKKKCSVLKKCFARFSLTFLFFYSTNCCSENGTQARRWQTAKQTGHHGWGCVGRTTWVFLNSPLTVMNIYKQLEPDDHWHPWSDSLV